jgi:WD40 repeat protein
VATGKETIPPLRHDDEVFAANFSPKGERIVTAGFNDRKANIWDTATGKLLRSIAQRDAVLSADFSSDGKRVLTICRFPDDKAYLWDAATGALVLGPIGTEMVNSAALSPDGTRLVTGERSACVWDVTTGKLLAKTAKHWGDVHTVAFSPGGTRIVTGTNGSIRVWETATAKPLTGELGSPGINMRVATFSTDGRRVLGMGLGEAAVWDVATGRELARAHGYDFYFGAAFNREGTRFVTSGVGSEGDPSLTCLWAVPPGGGD